MTTQVAPPRLADAPVTRRLDNGLVVYAASARHAPVATLWVWYHVGGRNEVPGTTGMSHFLEHMLFKGTARRTAKDISQEIEKIGGSLDAFTTKETMAVYAQVLESRREVAFDLISDMLANSSFAEEQVALERQVVIEEIGDVEDAPDDLIHELLAAEIYPDHPLGRPILGSRATVSTFRRADLVRYARRMFRASNMVVAVYGNVDEQELIEVCRERFRFPEGTLARDATRLRRPAVVRRHVRRKLHQQHIVMGRRTFSFLDERRYPMMVLNAMMGGGMSSRLFQKIREDLALAYNVFTYLDHSRDTGMFAAYMAVNPANARKAMKAVTAEFAAARNGGLTRAELDDTKEHIKGRILLGLETSTSRMMRLARNEISYGHQIPERELIDRIDSVSMEDVRALARELFDVDGFTVVSLGPSAGRL